MLKKRIVTIQIERELTTSVIGYVMNLFWDVMKIKPNIENDSFHDEPVQEFIITFAATNEKFAIVENRLEKYFREVLDIKKD